MLQATPTDSVEPSVPCSIVMRCGNCRRIVRLGFAVPAGTAERVQHAMDEVSLEVWSAFTCEKCDYDKAYVMALGIDAAKSERVIVAARRR